MKIKSLLVLFGTLLSASPAMALSPPWVVYQNEAKATLGADSCVHVDDLDQTSPSSYNLNIHVCDKHKAYELAKFASRTLDFGGTTVDVQVFGPYHHLEPHTAVSTNIHDASRELAEALGTNFYFLDILPAKYISDFFGEFCRGVVQYPADNIGDFYANNNVAAAIAFDEVLFLTSNTPVRIGVATSEMILCAGGGK